MTHPIDAWDAAAIERAAAQVIARRPAFASILGFYGPVFTAQAVAAAATSPPAITIDPSIRDIKAAEGFSVIEPGQFTIDLPAAEGLLREICRLATSSGEKLGRAGKALIQAMAAGRPMAPLLSDVLVDRDAIRSFAKSADVSPQMLSLLLYLAVKPSIDIGARTLATGLVERTETPGVCPICGSAPIMGHLDADGRQWLNCGICWHAWAVRRLVCPFCGNSDTGTLEYAYSDDEPEYRINLCGRCRCYLKMVDVRKIERPFYPPLEQVASLHLDILATDKGYRPAMASEEPTGTSPLGM